MEIERVREITQGKDGRLQRPIRGDLNYGFTKDTTPLQHGDHTSLQLGSSQDLAPTRRQSSPSEPQSSQITLPS